MLPGDRGTGCRLKTSGDGGKKRIPSGQLYLARTYNDLYRFEDAIKCYEEYITELSKRKRPTAEAERLLEKSKTNFRMLKGIEEVCIIDSIVVDKEHFLKAYKNQPRIGQTIHVQ